MYSKRMKILFVSSGRKGSISPITRNQGESLKRAGVDVDYYVISGRGWRGYLRNIKPLRTQIKTGNYDVIHAHYAWVGYLASVASIGLHTPMVVSLMGNDILDHRWYPGLAKFVAAIKPWKTVIVKSNEMKHRLGLRRAIVVPNGVNMEKFVELDKNKCQEQLGWEREKKHVLFPATPSEVRKNWPLAEKAVKILNDTGEHEIDLHGMVGVNNDETPIWYNAADVVVLPSFYEGSPNAVKEAMACGVPIVTTDMGDCRERLDGVDGCYVANSYDVEEFAGLLVQALTHNGHTKGREHLINDRIADFQIAEKLISLYNQ